MKKTKKKSKLNKDKVKDNILKAFPGNTNVDKLVDRIINK
jgi:hypothetical protein